MLNISEHVVVVYTNIFNGYLLNYILKTKHQKQSQDMLVIYKKWHHLAYMLLKVLGYDIMIFITSGVSMGGPGWIWAQPIRTSSDFFKIIFR